MRSRHGSMALLAVVVAAITLPIVPGTAAAATLRSGPLGLRYEAYAGEANVVRVVTEGRELLITDTGAASFDRRLPPQCTALVVDVGIGARCDAPGQQQLRVELGDGDDRLEAWELPRRVSLDVTTGDGENVVEGGDGDDRVRGGDGRDTLYGGPGADEVDGRGGNDYVRGHGGDDELRGGGGLNFIIGDGGSDRIIGGDDFEYITAGGGDDRIDAGGGADDVGAGRGDDRIDGGAGDDELRGGPGADRFDGGAGDDLLRARDGEGDRLDCGAGAGDVARVDAGEVDEARRSCETVRQADAPPTEPVDVTGITA